MNMQELDAAVYAACLAAAKALGNDTKGLSWFGSNHPSRVDKAA